MVRVSLKSSLRKRPIAALAFALLGLAGSAMAMGLRLHDTTVSWTEPAGAAGPQTKELTTGADYYALQALKLWEFDGRICSLQLDQGGLNARQLSSLDAAKVCEPKMTEAWKRADIGSGLFVTAIAVCVSNAKDAAHIIHGVELWGAAVGDNGKLKAGKKSARIEFSACKKWLPKRACPAGSVATGLRSYLDDAESGVVGLALRCQQVEVE
jgi:hypothetical protein